MKTICLAAAFALSMSAVSAHASLVTRTVDYTQGGVTFQGYLAYNDSVTPSDKAPGVLVFPEWWGLNGYAKHRADQLAKLGYVAFAVDMYGNGAVAKDRGEAGSYAGALYKKPEVMTERAQAGLDQLLATGLVDPAKAAAIGYCFGGAVAQTLAYSGAPLAGIVSFHGNLIVAPAGAAERTKAKLLICHGAADPTMKREQIDAFLKALDDGKIDYQFDQYAGALHAFTNPDADAVAAANGMTGVIGYSPSADRRSWQDMQDFFKEIFGPSKP